jgi:hypothetical protein
MNIYKSMLVYWSLYIKGFVNKLTQIWELTWEFDNQSYSVFINNIISTIWQFHTLKKLEWTEFVHFVYSWSKIALQLVFWVNNDTNM